MTKPPPVIVFEPIETGLEKLPEALLNWMVTTFPALKPGQVVKKTERVAAPATYGGGAPEILVI